MVNQLRELTLPFTGDYLAYIKTAQGQRPYLEHAVVNQRLLQVVGPFTFEVTELIRDPDGQVSGCLARMTLTFDDGDTQTVVEVGTGDPARNCGESAQLAASNALKRCAARFGLGLHIYTDHYWIDKSFDGDE